MERLEKRTRWLPVCTILLLQLLSGAQGSPECTELSSCACELTGVNNSGIIDLSFLSRNSSTSSPRFDTMDVKNWHYSFSPCKPFDVFPRGQNKSRVEPCHNSVVARWTDIGSVPECFSLGDPQPATFNYDAGSEMVSVTYINKTAKETRRAVIALVCNLNMTANESVFNLTSIDNPKNTYYFSLESLCCCPDGCPRMPVPTSSPGSSSGLSHTEVVIIAVTGFLLLVIMAVVGFFIVKRQISAHAVDDRLRQRLISDA